MGRPTKMLHRTLQHYESSSTVQGTLPPRTSSWLRGAGEHRAVRVPLLGCHGNRSPTPPQRRSGQPYHRPRAHRSRTEGRLRPLLRRPRVVARRFLEGHAARGPLRYPAQMPERRSEATPRRYLTSKGDETMQKCEHGARGGGSALPVLRSPAQPDDRRRGDELQLGVGHRQCTSPAGSEGVVGSERSNHLRRGTTGWASNPSRSRCPKWG